MEDIKIDNLSNTFQAKKNLEIRSAFEELLKLNNRNYRIYGNGYRIDAINLQFDYAKERIFFYFNDEKIISKKYNDDIGQWYRFLLIAESKLSKSLISISDFKKLLEKALKTIQKQQHTKANCFSLQDVYEAIKFSKKEIFVSRYIFIYNLEKFLQHDLKKTKCFGLETGGVWDLKNKASFVFNGLDPDQNYRTYCYLIKRR